MVDAGQIDSICDTFHDIGIPSVKDHPAGHKQG